MHDTFFYDCQALQFPEDAIRTLVSAREALSDPACGVPALFERAENELFNGTDNAFVKTLAEQTTEIPQKTVDMVFLVSCLPRLREKYRKAGVSEEIFRNTTADLKAKLNECHTVYGVWGTSVTYWYGLLFRMKLFAFGRLQYELLKFPFADIGSLHTGDTVLSCHIPTAGPLTPESVDDSLRRASAFFKDLRVDGVLPIICHSWLLYPPTVALFPENSNTAQFAARFTILQEMPDPKNNDFWRVFGKKFDPAVLPDLPEDTALRKNLKHYLLAGHQMGYGLGLILYKE